MLDIWHPLLPVQQLRVPDALQEQAHVECIAVVCCILDLQNEYSLRMAELEEMTDRIKPGYPKC